MKAITVPEWVDALRSGRYVQTQAALHTDKGFCCLGVAEDVAGTEWEIEEEGSDMGVFCDEWGACSFPSDSAKEMMGEVGAFMLHGYPVPNVPLCYLCRERVLAEMNDEGFTFSEIADSIMGMYLG